MSPFTHPVRIANVLTGASAEVEALVDTGSTFSVAPGPLLERLGVQPMRTVECELADGSVVQMPVGYVEVALNGEAGLTLCGFGRPDAEAILGATAMETLLLAPDPVNRTFIKVRARL